MNKRIIALLLAVIMLVGVAAGCRGAEEKAPEVVADPAEATPEETPTGTENYKIGIITGTVSQGEEEFQAAEKMKRVYGDRIVTSTYPDNFTAEVETVISNVVALADDPEVKAIVFLQAVPGASAAIDRVRETREDILFIAGVPGENPQDIAAKADIVLNVDDLAMGPAVAEQASAQGAKTLIHYSFPRHMSYVNIAARHELMKAKAEELGIEFVDVTAPDPTGDSGVAGAQQFILEDVPRQVEKYGKDTAFFSTNCSMQEPLIRSIVEQGAIFPQQCCPSPYHGYPAALGIDVAGHEGDVQYMLDQITAKAEESGMEGRMSTWPAPVNMVMVEAGTAYAIEYAEGRTDGRVDEKVLYEQIAKVSAEYDAETTIDKYVDEGTLIPNFYLIKANYVNFGNLASLEDDAEAVVEEAAEAVVDGAEAVVEGAEEAVEEAVA